MTKGNGLLADPASVQAMRGNLVEMLRQLSPDTTVGLPLLLGPADVLGKVVDVLGIRVAHEMQLAEGLERARAIEARVVVDGSIHVLEFSILALREVLDVPLIDDEAVGVKQRRLQVSGGMLGEHGIGVRGSK